MFQLSAHMNAQTWLASNVSEWDCGTLGCCLTGFEVPCPISFSPPWAEHLGASVTLLRGFFLRHVGGSPGVAF